MVLQLLLQSRFWNLIPRKKKWINEDANIKRTFYNQQRIDPAPGIHSIIQFCNWRYWDHSHRTYRTGFATGAVLAAEFIAAKKEFYNERCFKPLTLHEIKRSAVFFLFFLLNSGIAFFRQSITELYQQLAQAKNTIAKIDLYNRIAYN